MSSDGDTFPITRALKDAGRRFQRYYESLISSEKNAKAKSPLYSTTIEHVFPLKSDSPETREEKFEVLTEMWMPKTDLLFLNHGPFFATGVASCIQLPFLQYVRKLFKVASYNRFIASTSVMSLAAAVPALVVFNQNNSIIRGDVLCADCHLIRTAAFSFFFSTCIPCFSSVVVSAFTAFTNPVGIILPIDVLERWPATKAGIRIFTKTVYTRKTLLGLFSIAFINMTVGVGIVYMAMKEYHDVHARLLAENGAELVI